MVRQKCLDRGLSLNEYSLKDSNTKKVVEHEFSVEKDIFDYLDMKYVEPTDR
jgi:DNA polymerase/3'-5' exonuclease PolX